MQNPLETPPTRKTTHGVVMSPRLSRLYTWIQANGVQLNDFSTDECVARNMTKLESLRSELLGLLDARHVAYLSDLAIDLHNLMQRTPANRVTR